MKFISTKSKLTIKLFLTFIISFLIGMHLSGQTTFEQQPIDQDHTPVSGVACHDYDLDGDIDIFACHIETNQVLLWENDGNLPAGWTKKLVQDMTSPLYIISEDVNNDTLKDLIISGNNNSIFCLININAENQWQTFVLDDDFNNPHGVFVSDLNNDGLKDIIATARNDHEIAWWENNGENPDTWTKHIVSNQINGSQTVSAADLNNDGFKDIIGGSSLSNEVVVFYNNGDSPLTFTKQVANQSLQLPHWVSVADIDDDGNLDILVAACASGKVVWLKNNGGNPITWIQYTIGSNFGCALTVEATDIDMDGDLDVAATAWGSNRVAWWEQQKNGVQISWAIHNLSTNYKGAWPLVFSDVDLDTDMDIVTGGDLLDGSGDESPLSWWENKTLTTSVASQNVGEQKIFKIWPQPASNNIHISYTLQEDSHVSISIFDALGNKIGDVLNQKQSKGIQQIDLDLLSLNKNIIPGIYFCKLSIDKDLFINKLVIASHQ